MTKDAVSCADYDDGYYNGGYGGYSSGYNGYGYAEGNSYGSYDNGKRSVVTVTVIGHPCHGNLHICSKCQCPAHTGVFLHPVHFKPASDGEQTA
jgi:hypothetical protein